MKIIIADGKHSYDFEYSCQIKVKSPWLAGGFIRDFRRCELESRALADYRKFNDTIDTIRS